MKKTTQFPLAACMAIALAACASSAPPPKPYDPNLEASKQAPAFIKTQNEKHMKGVDKVGITACNVMFATSASAHAATSAGLFDTSNRAEASVSTVYTLDGLSENDMQKLTDQICSNAENKLSAAGYDVVSHSELKKNEAFQKLQEAGKPSPYQYKAGDSRYLVFTRTGDSVFDERYIGTASGLGQAFKAAAGGAAWQHEAVALDSMDITGVNLNILIDFAEMSSSGTSRGIASKNTAEVGGKVLLSATGGIKLKPHDKLKCWKRFGKHECSIDLNKQPNFDASRSINVPDAFYTSVDNVTTKGDKVAAGVTKALSMLGGGTSRSVTRYQVNVTPKGYTEVQQTITDGLLDMAISRSTEFR